MPKADPVLDGEVVTSSFDRVLEATDTRRPRQLAAELSARAFTNSRVHELMARPPNWPARPKPGMIEGDDNG